MKNPSRPRDLWCDSARVVRPREKKAHWRGCGKCWPCRVRRAYRESLRNPRTLWERLDRDRWA